VRPTGRTFDNFRAPTILIEVPTFFGLAVFGIATFGLTTFKIAAVRLAHPPLPYYLRNGLYHCYEELWVDGITEASNGAFAMTSDF